MNVKRYVPAFVLALLCACGPIPPPDPPAQQATVACVVKDVDAAPIVGAMCGLTGNDYGAGGYTNSDGYYAFNFVPFGVMTLSVSKVGYVSYKGDYQINGNTNLPVALASATPPLPPIPTRDQILGSVETFQGLTIQGTQYGDIPYYEAPFTSLNAADRQKVYAVKKAAGDQLLGMTVSWNYCGQSYGFCYPVPGRDLSQDLQTLRGLVEEAIRAGFYVDLRMSGDGMSVNDNPQPGQYNDPVGWTYGYQWLMANTSRVIDSLNGDGGAQADLTPYIIFVPGYDGVVPGWPEPSYSYPGKLDNWLLMTRSLIPNGYIGVELAAGYAHWGCEARCYTTPAGQGLDIVFQEYGSGPMPTSDPDQVWQIAARQLGTAYNRPPEQPSWDDPPPTACYLCPGTPRGPFYANALEYDTYLWVRNRIDVGTIATDRQYLKARGYKIVGH